MKALLHLLLIMTGVFALRAAEPEMQKPIELTTLLGETYHNARIIKATPEAITVVHDAGVSKVLFENLGDDWKQKYNYNPDKAREFQKQEDEKRQLAEENRKKAQKEREDESSKQMAELALRESQRAELDAKLARQQAESASRTKALNSSTESVVPPTSPITQIYTPGYTRGQGVQSTIISEAPSLRPVMAVFITTIPATARSITLRPIRSRIARQKRIDLPSVRHRPSSGKEQDTALETDHSRSAADSR